MFRTLSIPTKLKPYPSCPPGNFLLTTRVTAKMPVHFSFAFGVGNLFNFQFNYGRRREPSPARCDHRSGITDWDMAKVGAFNFPRFNCLLKEHQKSGVKIDPKDEPVTPKDQDECPLFFAIPVEIRHMIYHHILTTLEPIEKAHKHLGSKDTALLDNYKPIPNIDATILRTCRMIYNEALPILYGQNTFTFSSANSIRSFQSKSLIGYPLGGFTSFRDSGT